VPETGTRVFIGPANFAGQGALWVDAIRRLRPDADGVSYALDIPGGFDFPTDYTVTALIYRRNRRWQRELLTYVASGFTHVIIEAERPLFADLFQLNCFAEARALEKRGVRVAMIAHGTDVRLPSRHAQAHPWSPFLDRDWDVVGQLEAKARKNLDGLARFDGPVFVSTPDLLDDVPHATWCPVVVDPNRWRNEESPLVRAVPVVAHAPSNSRVKGTDLIEEALRSLVDEGTISYRRITGVPSAEMPGVYTTADVVLDQFRLGSYGVAACEAMAAGRVVVGNVTEDIRRRVLEATGIELPIVQAEPDNIGKVVRDLVADRDRSLEIARSGPEFVRTVHDGRFSVRQLGGFLDKAPGTRMSPRPHVVVIPGNDVLSDARVLKYVATLVSLGLRVTAVGITRKGERQEFDLGGARVIIESVPAPTSTTTRKHRGQLGIVFRFGYRTPDEHRAARAQVIRWTRRIRAEQGLRRRVLSVALLVPRAWTRLAALRTRTTSSPGPSDDEIARLREAEIRRYRADPTQSPWRTILPEIVEDDRVVGALLDGLDADVVHVQDVFMLGVAAGAVRRARAAGRHPWLVYDAHEYIPGVAFIPARTVGAYCALEKEFIGETDRIVTVSEPLADRLTADHALERHPDVVLNAPTVAPPPEGFRTLREVVGLSDDVPLLVYGGGVNSARGVHTAVGALAELPGVHLAVVTNRRNYVVEALVQQAQEIGVADRLHLADYVAPELVTHYFSTVSIGLSTLLRGPNHDVAVTNKFCEYLVAGVPIVTSDTPAQARLVDELDLGAVYPADDVAGLVTAVSTVLADQDRIRRRIRDDAELRHRFSWAAQAARVREIYAELLGELPEEAWRDDALDITSVSRPASPQ